MLRSLYRVYLYTVIIVLLYFTAISTAILVGTLLTFTPLNGSGQRPFIAHDVTQPAAFAAIAWLITVLVGGLHYWLLRRDERTDAMARSGAVRALFVNFAEGLAAFVALIGANIALSFGLNGGNGGGAGGYATLFTFTALFALFEIERRRGQAAAGVAVIFQRMHFYIMQLIIVVFFLWGALSSALQQALLWLLLTTGALTQTCQTSPYSSYPACSISGNYSLSYSNHQIIMAWLLAAIVTLWWGGYWLLMRKDERSGLRLTLRILGFSTGVILILIGLERGFEYGARAVLQSGAQLVDIIYQYPFIPLLLTGMVIAGVYALWLRADGRRWPETRSWLWLSATAMTAALSALVFYLGVGLSLDFSVEHLVPGGSQPDKTMLATAIGLTLAGIGYIPLALWLRAQTQRQGAAIAPRRAFGLALLALGTLTTVIALVVLLYATVTAALGNPPANWQQVARSAGCALAVGAVIVILYTRLAFSERWLVGAQHTQGAQPVTVPAEAQASAPPIAAPTVAPPAPLAVGTIGVVLDDLLAGRLTRDQAAARISALASGREG